MKLTELLDIRPGITAVIGGGGKTTLMATLARELEGTVILTTSTKIFPSAEFVTLPDPSSVELSRALSRHRILCIGSPAAEGKLSSPSLPFEALAKLADYVLVEADGSKHLPLKAHRPQEPVIPAESNQAIYVLGADGFGRPIEEVCHRPALYSTRCEAPERSPVTPELAAKVLKAEGLGDRFLINKVESPQDRENAALLSKLLDCPVIAGSLHEEEYFCLR